MNDPAEIRRTIAADAVVDQVAMRDGWKIRAFDWPAQRKPARGAILFMGGRGDIIEKYLECFAGWHEQGWHVSAADWRGQGGSGRLSANRHVGHVDDFAPWIEDLAELYDGWRASTPQPHVVIGHSMGGHLVLRALAEHRIAPDAAVAVAPMMGFAKSPVPQAWAQRLASWLAPRFGANRPAWPGNERPALPWASRQKMLTSSRTRYADEVWWKEQKPELELGPPSWPWLSAAYRSMAAMTKPGVAEAINIPLLVLATEGDQLVDSDAARSFAGRVPDARLRMFGPDVAHEILRERDGPRGEALAAIEAFLDEVAPAA